MFTENISNRNFEQIFLDQFEADLPGVFFLVATTCNWGELHDSHNMQPVNGQLLLM